MKISQTNVFAAQIILAVVCIHVKIAQLYVKILVVSLGKDQSNCSAV